MELKHQCSNCEFNFDGVGAGSISTYGQRIVDDSKCYEDWRTGLEYYTYECAVAPRFLREKYHDGSLAYPDFSTHLLISGMAMMYQSIFLMPSSIFIN